MEDGHWQLFSPLFSLTAWLAIPALDRRFPNPTQPFVAVVYPRTCSFPDVYDAFHLNGGAAFSTDMAACQHHWEGFLLFFPEGYRRGGLSTLEGLARGVSRIPTGSANGALLLYGMVVDGRPGPEREISSWDPVGNLSIYMPGWTAGFPVSHLTRNNNNILLSSSLSSPLNLRSDRTS